MVYCEQMAAAKTETEDGPCCPICLEQFNIPRQLPCAHSFCEKCLQSRITTEAKNHTKFYFFKCPVCGNSASPAIKDRPTNEWASLFPTNSVIQTVLAESKVCRLCDACNTEGDAVPAEGLCVFCKEAMCGNCLKLHRRQKISKDHTIISVDELDCNPENVMKLAEGFTCSEHHGEDIKYYCKDHKVPCCGTCFFEGHKLCTEVIDLKQELPALLCDSKPDDTIADMKNIENHLKTFMEMNESFVNDLEPQVDRMTERIRDGKRKINAALDQLEIEGSRIYKEEVLRIQDENHKCLSLIHAVKHSHHLLEAARKYGSNLQKFLMLEKVRLQLQSYCNLVGENYMKTDTTTLEIEFASPIESILPVPLLDVGKVVSTTSSNTLPLTCLQGPTKDCQVERVDVIDLQVPTGKTPWYSHVSFLPGDRVMLADYNNNQCILLSSSYQFITSLPLTGQPWNICVLDDQEVAVSLYNQNEIQILSVIGDIIRPVRVITTSYNCNGIAAAGKGEIVINGYCDNNKCQWSLINMRGDVKCTHQYDSPTYYLNYIALNNTKTRVYVSVYAMNSLLCFDLDGRKQFAYSPNSLRHPFGVAVDNYDNIYVLGNSPESIHQLSQDGSVIQVVYIGVPKSQWAICIHQSKDILVITNTSDERTKLQIYQQKYI